MGSIPDFGTYAFTVWACYGVSIAVLLSLTFYILRQKAKIKNGR